jgi:purine-binding chemotaxis protein CheW
MDQRNVSVEAAEPAAPYAHADVPIRVCLITLGNELYAIDLRSVREVFEVDAVTPVPGMPSTLTGVANLRGTVVPLVDLRLMLGLPTTGAPPQFAVVIRHGTNQIGLLIDRVPEIRTVQKEQLLPAGQGEPSESRRFVSRVLRLEDRLGGVLEVPVVFEQVEGKPAVLHVT